MILILINNMIIIIILNYAFSYLLVLYLLVLYC